MGAPPVGHVQEDRLMPIFQGIAVSGLLAAAFVEFVPAAVLFVVNLPNVPTFMSLTLIVPAMLWAAVFLGAQGSIRVLLLNATGIVLLCTQLVADQGAGPTWFPLPFAAFAVAFGAAFSLTVVPAIAVVLAAAVLNAIAVWRPTQQLILVADELAGGWIGPLFIVIAGLGLVGVAQSWRRVATVSDTRTAEIEHAAESAYRAVQVHEAKASVERRIHETVLNTLNAIAHGWHTDSDVLRAQCREHLTQLDVEVAPAGTESLSAIIQEAVAAAGPLDAALEVELQSDAQVSWQVSTALRDAIVEALRNVQRHARADRVWVSVRTFGSRVVVEVVDDGVGFSLGTKERFGIRNSVRGSMAAIGGEALFDSSPGRGTTLKFTAPIALADELKLPADPALDILLRPLSARLLLLAAAVFGLAMLPWIQGGLDTSAPWMAVAYLMFFGANLFLAFGWHGKSRPLAALSVIFTTIAVYATTYAAIDGCLTTSSTHWIINSVGGGLSLLLFASFGRWWHWFVVPGMSVLGLWLMFALPYDCRGAVVMPLIVTVVYLAAAMYVIAVLFQASDRQRRRATELWAAATAQRAELERQITVSIEWNQVTTSARALIAGIADGEIDVKALDVQERAANEESQLRANLGLGRDSGSAMWRDVLEAVAEGAAAGIGVDAHCIETPVNDRPLPPAATALLRSIIANAPSLSVQLRLFVDQDVAELVCICPKSAAHQAWAATFSEEAVMPVNITIEDDVVIDADEMEDGTTYLSIRQH